MFDLDRLIADCHHEAVVLPIRAIRGCVKSLAQRRLPTRQQVVGGAWASRGRAECKGLYRLRGADDSQRSVWGPRD